MIRSSRGDTFYRVYTDQLGSPQLLTNELNQEVERYSFDAWGKRRNPNIWKEEDLRPNLILSRGFTGHEHLDAVGLIDMRGRVYDPLTAMFLSPDPYIQAPENWLNYNRYAYCLGNPYRYTDPNGEFWHLLIGAAIGGTLNWLFNGAKFTWEGLAYFGVGALAGSLGAGVGAGISSAIAGSSFGAGFLGTAAAGTAVSSAISGAAIGAGGGLSGGFVSGTGNGLINGRGWNSLVDGLISGGIGGLAGGIAGGLVGGISAGLDGRNFWHGGRVIQDVSINMPNMQQNGELDCRYEVFRSNDKYYNDNFQSIDNLRSNFPNVETNDVAYGKMYGKNNMSLRERTFDFKEMSSNIEKANMISSSLSEGKSVVYEMYISDKMGHATAINRVRIYDNSRILINLMNPSGAGGYTLTNFKNLLRIFQVIPIQ